MKIDVSKETQVGENSHKPDVRKLYDKAFAQIKATKSTSQTKLL